MNNFLKYKYDFDSKYQRKNVFDCFLPIHLELSKKVKIRNKNNVTNEEYYKWQYLYAIVHSGMYAKDYIGVEVHFPKGNKNSAPIKLDAAIFDSIDWWTYYSDFHKNKSQESLEWLRKHLLGIIEFKKEDSKDIETVWNKQLKPYLKESERDFCFGVIYDTERLYLFRKQTNKYLRLSEEYNQKGEASGLRDLTLHLPDPYINHPDYDEILNFIHPKDIDRSKRSILDLDVISGIHSKQINDAMSTILRTMDKQGLVNQKGYEILIQILALKIFDEKRNEKGHKKYLEFYILREEKNYKSINDTKLQEFIERIQKLRDDAEGDYYRILRDNPFNIKNENHIKVLLEVVTQFQDYSFVQSHKTDLYQLVFYRFANAFSKDQKAQFITPLPLIDFLVSVVNPRNGETVIDPTVGIADFLSISYVNSKSKLDDNNIFGLEVDDQMVMLATLNMLLNGDGNAKIKAQPGYGSILTKFDHKNELMDLVPSSNKKGAWEKRGDDKKLKLFDVVLTNPPFGEDRAFKPKDDTDLEVIECYDLWYVSNSDISNKTKSIDLGLIFLENAYRILKENGRMGIVLSNSLASIDKHQKSREWLMNRMRIVAIFDLPANVFAETGVNTTLIVAYKPKEKDLKKLLKDNYEIFAKDIKKVGYEVKTSKRVKYFETKYKINYETFEVEIDSDGRPKLDEDFSSTLNEFREWTKSQEKNLQDIFIKEK